MSPTFYKKESKAIEKIANNFENSSRRVLANEHIYNLLTDEEKLISELIIYRTGKGIKTFARKKSVQVEMKKTLRQNETIVSPLREPSKKTTSNLEAKTDFQTAGSSSLSVDFNSYRLFIQRARYTPQLRSDSALFNKYELNSKISDREILTLLERQPLTIENLAESVESSIDEVGTVIIKLFEKGDIDRVESGILYKIFPDLFWNTRRQVQISNSDTHLTLTLKGYFRLHPLISIRR